MRPNDIAFTFTDYESDSAGVPESLTWSQLSRRTLNLAHELSRHGSVGDRAVILAPQSPLRRGIPGIHAGRAHRGSTPLAAPRLDS